MPTHFKLSIAVTTCNGERYLREQLNSFLAQSRLPEEVVISDDASTDSTREILEEFAANAPFEVKIRHNETRLGYAQNFSRALEQTTGDLVFLSDQDDVWFPEKLEAIATLAVKQPDILCWMNDAVFTDGQLNSLGFTKLQQLRRGGYKPEFYVMGCVAAVRRSLLDLALPIPEGVKAHDNWVIGLADILRAKTIIDQPLQYYRRHGANESQGLINKHEGISRLQKWRQRIRRIFAPIDPEAQKESIKQDQGVISGLERIMSGLTSEDHAQPLNHSQSTHLTQSRPSLQIHPLPHRQPRTEELLQSRLLREQDLLYAKQIWVEPGSHSFHRRILALRTVLASGEYDKAFGIRSAIRCFISIG